jgi:TolB-like protein
MATIRITAAAAVLLLSASFAAAEIRGSGERGAPAVAASAGVQAADAEAGDRVAVLPFANITGLNVDDWFGVGIVETLAAALEGAGVPVVRGDTATADNLAAGRALGARWVISGSYQRQARQLRITARVVEVATGAVLRTAIVDGPVTDLFDLQDRLAADLEPGLAGAPSGEERLAETAAPAVIEPRTGSPVAAAEPAPARPAAPPAPEAGERPAAPAAGERPAAAGFAARGSAIIGAPPPPVPPATINRDASGRATLRKKEK